MLRYYVGDELFTDAYKVKGEGIFYVVEGKVSKCINRITISLGVNRTFNWFGMLSARLNLAECS